MKSKIYMLLLVVGLVFVSGCGGCSRAYDNLNYESITNERAKVIYVLSGGKIMFEYRDCKIIYSNSDSQTIKIEYQGDKIYIQGDIVIVLDD